VPRLAFFYVILLNYRVSQKLNLIGRDKFNHLIIL